MSTDPLTQEYESQQESALELEQKAREMAAQKTRESETLIEVTELEAKLRKDDEQAVVHDSEPDDGFINNTWEVTGSAVEQATEQVVRSLADITEFSEDWGAGKLFIADSEYAGDAGFKVPFTNKKVGYMSKEEFDQQAIAYEIATGKLPSHLIGDFDLPDVDRPDSTLGQMTSGFIQWGIVFAATRKAGLGNISGAVVADFAAFDPHEARLSDLIRQWGEGNPAFDNAFTEWMSADPTDAAAEGRLKNALEGVVIGTAIEGVMRAFRWRRSYNAAKEARSERLLKDQEVLEPKGPDAFDDLKFDDDGQSILISAELDAPREGGALGLDPDDMVVLGEKEAGKIEVTRRGGTTLQVNNSAVDPTFQNQGKGKQLYDEAVKIADNEGLELVSDNSVSSSAARVWESMARRGDDIYDMRKVDPDNIDVQVREDGTKQYWSKNGEPIFRRKKPDADAGLDTAARDAMDGGAKPKETFHDVALRQLKAALGTDPAKLRAIKAAIESGDTHAANELLDFNTTTVDWEELARQTADADSPDEFRRIINAFSEVFEQEMKDAQGYQSMAETLARSVGTTADDVLRLGRDVKGGKGLAARMAGADTFLYQSVQELRRLAKAARDTGSHQDMMAFYRQMDLHATLQATIKGSRSEIARALRQMQRVSAHHIDDFKEFDDLMRDATGLGNDQRLHLAQKIADLKDMNQINQMVRKSRWRRALDVWVEVYINGLLSGISTVMLNNTSNTLKLIEGITERYFAAAIGGVKNTGRRLLGRESRDAVSFREANAYLYGTIAGFDEAMHIPFRHLLSKEGRAELTSENWGTVFRAFVDEKPVLDTRMRVDADTRKAISMIDESDMSIRESIRTLNLKGVDWDAKAVNTVGKLVRIPGRLIITSDEFFKQITYNQHLASRAYKDGDAIARAKGKTGKQRLAIIERTHRNYREFPPEDVRFESMNHARYQTFQQDLPNGMARDFETFINRHPSLKFIIPFYRTPVNILKQTILERSPLGFVKAHKSELFRRIAAGGPEGDIALARLATGSMFIGWAANQAMSGKITGGGHNTTLLANTETMDNIPPYSVKVGDKWYQYNRLEPLGMLMGLAADIALAAEWAQEEDDVLIQEASSLALTVVAANITDKTWFKGVADLVNAFTNPARGGVQYFNRQTATMVTPYSSLLRRINTDHDDLAREAWTWMDNWKANVPGFSDDLPISYDLLGQPRYKRDYLGPAWASPIAVGEERDDPVYKEIVRLGFDYRKPGKDLFGTGEAVENEVYSEVMRLKGTIVESGMTLHERLDDLFNSAFYTDMLSDEGKADAAKTIISGYLRAAKGRYLENNPDYMDGVEQKKIELKEALRIN